MLVMYEDNFLCKRIDSIVIQTDLRLFNEVIQPHKALRLFTSQSLRLSQV